MFHVQRFGVSGVEAEQGGGKSSSGGNGGRRTGRKRPRWSQGAVEGGSSGDDGEVDGGEKEEDEDGPNEILKKLLQKAKAKAGRARGEVEASQQSRGEEVSLERKKSRSNSSGSSTSSSSGSNSSNSSSSSSNSGSNSDSEEDDDDDDDEAEGARSKADGKKHRRTETENKLTGGKAAPPRQAAGKTPQLKGREPSSSSSSAARDTGPTEDGKARKSRRGGTSNKEEEEKEEEEEEDEEEDGDSSSSASFSSEEEEEEEEEDAEVAKVGAGAKSSSKGFKKISKGDQEGGSGNDTEESQDQDDKAGTRPVNEVAKEWGLAPRLTETLKEQGVEVFFPIQLQVVPDICSTQRHPLVQTRDVCVSAPTGSGKTLVYVLGTLQALLQRKVTRLRALVMLPTRDLAMQVHSVFQTYCKGTGLTAGLAIGQTDFAEEQLRLVGPCALIGNPVAASKYGTWQWMGPGAGSSGMAGSDEASEQWRFGQGQAPSGGVSRVDVLVATPGRLLDHLKQTPGFTLQHLQFLVIDEADRLLTQSYQEWVGEVIKAAYREGGSPPPSSPASEASPSPTASSRRSYLNPFDFVGQATTNRGRPLAAATAALSSSPRSALVSSLPLRKLLFSATLTRNPQKLSSLELVNPMFYSAVDSSSRQQGWVDASSGGTQRPNQQTSRVMLDAMDDEPSTAAQMLCLPATLRELTSMCDSRSKPLVLLCLLQDYAKDKLAVVFTNSVDSTHRLFRLLQLWGGFMEEEQEDSNKDDDDDDDDTTITDGGVAEFSSSLSQRQRSVLVQRAKSGLLRVIVSSDGMARGMDLPNVACVINYEAPLNHAKTYVHRVGRTARAGKSGVALTLIKKGQESNFRRMREQVQGGRNVRPAHAPVPEPARLEGLATRFKQCLGELRQVMDAESSGQLPRTAPVDPLPR